jgi:serine/threonine protein phosphatase PrpC
MVSEEEINRILQTEAEPEQACLGLVTRANEAGGKDNITVVVAHFGGANQPEAAARNRTAVEGRVGPADPVTDTISMESDRKAAPVLMPSTGR